MKDELDKKLSEGMDKKILCKRLGIVFVELSILIISINIFVIMVSNHSMRLFNKDILLINNIVLIISIILLILGILLFIKYFNIPYIIKRSAIIIYAALFGIVVFNSITFLYLLYGPNKAFKQTIINIGENIDKYSELPTYFYSDEEIEKIKKGDY